MTAGTRSPASKKELRKLSKKEQIARSREGAKIKRERERKRRIRNRILIACGLTVAVAVTGTATVVVLQARSREANAGPENMASNGLLLTGDGTTMTATRTDRLEEDDSPTPTAIDETDGIVAVTAYLDFADPDSMTFLTTNSDLETWVTGGYVTLELHPVALVDTAVNDDYSVRAANAFACVAQYAPDSAYAVAVAMASAYPADDADPPSDDELVLLVQNAGVTDDDAASCITDGRFRPWVTRVTERATSTGIPNTSIGALTAAPVILVNREQYTGEVSDADAFTDFVIEQYDAEVGTSTDDGTTD
ncbi:MAG: thioredoxin domain-containing protein [Protaetiibacter sp.]